MNVATDANHYSYDAFLIFEHDEYVITVKLEYGGNEDLSFTEVPN
jgi:hypothetical protein